MNMGLDQDANKKKGAETKKSSVKKARDAKRGASSIKSKKSSKLIRPEIEVASSALQDETKVKTKSAAPKLASTKPRLTQQNKKPEPSQQDTAPAFEPMTPGVEFGGLAENMAELVDQGRKALAVALGGVDAEETRSELAASVADATKALGVVAEY